MLPCTDTCNGPWPQQTSKMESHGGKKFMQNICSCISLGWTLKEVCIDNEWIGSFCCLLYNHLYSTNQMFNYLKIDIYQCTYIHIEKRILAL